MNTAGIHSLNAEFRRSATTRSHLFHLGRTIRICFLLRAIGPPVADKFGSCSITSMIP